MCLTIDGPPDHDGDSMCGNISAITKHKSKTTYHKLNSRIAAIENDLQKLLESPDLDVNDATRTNAAFLADELEHLVRIKAKNRRSKLKANLA
jgi:hypothetical protein